MSKSRAVIALLTILVSIALVPGADARQRWPVIGCNGPLPYENGFSWRYAPSGYCETGNPLGTLAGIDDAHWSHWGQRRATATGLLVDGLGFKYSARITAYDHVVTHHAFGGLYLNYYAKLHVVSPGGYRGGVFRGPFNVVMKVVPGT